MATVGPPPPPLPSGPGKGLESGHKVSKVVVPIQEIRDRHEGKSPSTARPTDVVIKNPNQPQYLVHVLTEKPPAKWQKCSNGEARYFADAGYAVYEIRKGKAHRVHLVAVQQPGSWDSAVLRQFQEIEQEEIDRIVRHEHLPGEDIMDDDGGVISSGDSSAGEPEVHRSPPASRPGTATSPPGATPPRPGTSGAQSGGPTSSPARSPSTGQGFSAVGNKGKGPRRDGSGGGTAST